MLEGNEIQLWHASLDVQPAALEDLQRTLTMDEWRKAGRFRLHRDRNRFIVARGLLRVILASYLHKNPAHLRFSYGPYGKPTLATKPVGDTLDFSLSHSDGIALYAVTRGRELGVDLERIRPDRADENVAEQFFSPRELAVLRALPPNVWHEAFFACWTRKEAYIKARGGGFTIPLKQFSVSISGEEPAVLLENDDNRLVTSRWSLLGLNLGPDWAAALAVEGQGWRQDFTNGPDIAPPQAVGDEGPSNGSGSSEMFDCDLSGIPQTSKSEPPSHRAVPPTHACRGGQILPRSDECGAWNLDPWPSPLRE